MTRSSQPRPSSSGWRALVRPRTQVPGKSAVAENCLVTPSAGRLPLAPSEVSSFTQRDADTEAAAYRRLNEIMVARYPHYAFVLKDPRAFVADMRNRFEA